MPSGHMKRTFQLVVAASRDFGIGNKGTLPWKLPGDMRYFKELTSKASKPSARNAVIMGRTTWESIPEKFRPLPGRLNIVLTRSPPAANDENSSSAANCASPCRTLSKPVPGVLYASSLENAMALLDDEALVGKVETAFVIGGGQVYKEAVKSDRCQAIHITRIDADYPCDTYFPNIDQDDSWRLWSTTAPKRENGVRYSFQCYVRNQQPSTADQQQQQESSWVPPGIASRHQEYQVST